MDQLTMEDLQAEVHQVALLIMVDQVEALEMYLLIMEVLLEEIALVAQSVLLNSSYLSALANFQLSLVLIKALLLELDKKLVLSKVLFYKASLIPLIPKFAKEIAVHAKKKPMLLSAIKKEQEDSAFKAQLILLNL